MGQNVQLQQIVENYFSEKASHVKKILYREFQVVYTQARGVA